MKKIGITVVLLTVLLGGCQLAGGETPEVVSANKELQALLPSQENYTWQYDGFAEYGHQMQLESITLDSTSGEASYKISGLVDDVSGGEAPGDYSIDLTYTIGNGQLQQTWVAPRMMDTPFEQIVLIQTPLEIETQWTQQVINQQNGESRELTCTIINIASDEGIKSYDVYYEDQQSGYYEIRTIKEGHGVVAYKKLIELGGKEYEIGYLSPEAYSNSNTYGE